MAGLSECVTERRSIRRFQTKPIDRDKLMRVLEAARWTPSWANTQCWEVIVVTDQGHLSQMAEALSPKNPASIAMKKGPLTLAICGAKEKSGFYKGEQSTAFGDWFMYDLGLLTQTICLASHDEGLGSVIVGAFNHAKVKEILRIKEGYEVVALLPMGYPDHTPSPPKRRELNDFIHYEEFGQKATG